MASVAIQTMTIKSALDNMTSGRTKLYLRIGSLLQEFVFEGSTETQVIVRDIRGIKLYLDFDSISQWMVY